jgi:competence protein ComEA
MELHALTPALRRALAAAALAVVLVVLVVKHVSGGGASAPIPALRVAKRSQAAAAAGIVVDVVGAVRRAGLYTLPPRSRIADAVAHAGGATAHADLALVNLAAPLADGEQVVVPVRGVAGATAAGAANAPVDLNSATAEELDALPGIGPATAAKIVAFRAQHGPFHATADLDAVPGIGPARIAELKGLVVP